MRVESDAKFEEKLALGFKNDMMNLVHFDVLLLSIAYIKFQLKSAKELSLTTLKSDPSFEEKLTFCLKIDIEEWKI